jgi:hypothetical protein
MKQIFKENIPKEYFIDYIKTNCILVDNNYVYNKECFKRSCLNNNEKISSFINFITPYYHISSFFDYFTTNI